MSFNKIRVHSYDIVLCSFLVSSLASSNPINDLVNDRCCCLRCNLPANTFSQHKLSEHELPNINFSYHQVSHHKFPTCKIQLTNFKIAKFHNANFHIINFHVKNVYLHTSNLYIFNSQIFNFLTSCYKLPNFNLPTNKFS